MPWDRVFLCGETEHTQELDRLSGSFTRFCYGGCKVGIADVALGAASLIARPTAWPTAARSATS